MANPELQALREASIAASDEVRAAQQAMYDALERPIDPVLELRLRAREAATAPVLGQPVVHVYDGFLDPSNYVDQVPPGLRDMVEPEIARAQAHGVAIGTPERPLRVLTNSLTAAALGAREGLVNLPTDTLHLSTLFPLRTLAEQRAIVAHEWHHAVTGALQIPAGAHAEANAASEALSRTAEGVSNPAMWPAQRDVPNPRWVEAGRILAPGDLGESKFLQGPIFAPGTDGYYHYSYGTARVFAAAMGEVSRRYPAQFEELFYLVSTGPPGSIQGTDDLARAFRTEAARRWGGGSGIASLVDRALTRAGWPP
jgi:hypothetical protein